jgi:uncharacterized membrane protein
MPPILETNVEEPQHWARRLRGYLVTGVLVLAPTVVTAYVLFRLLNWVDNLLGQFLRFGVFDYHRIPGIGLVTTALVLIGAGWLAERIGSRPLSNLWDRMLSRIPGLGLVYGSTKSIGEAFLAQREGQAFRRVVLVRWPHEAMWRVGFVTGPVDADVRARVGDDALCVFVPHSPNPASGFVHYVPERDVVPLDWSVQDGLRVIVSGGVVQPGGGAIVIPAAGIVKPRE